MQHIQNSTYSAHCNTGQSVWTVPRKFCYHGTSRNESREGGQWVDVGEFVGVGTCWKNQVDGGPQLGLSGKGSVSFLYSRRLLFSDPSVLTSLRSNARNAAQKSASGPAGENWAKLAKHILNAQSHHATAYRLTALLPSCISIGRANKMV